MEPAILWAGPLLGECFQGPRRGCHLGSGSLPRFNHTVLPCTSWPFSVLSRWGGRAVGGCCGEGENPGA